MSDKIEASAGSFVEYLNKVAERIQQYEQYFKEIIKYNTRAKCSTRSIQKALELIQSLPKRAAEAVFTANIHGYPSDIYKLGRIMRQVSFSGYINALISTMFRSHFKCGRMKTRPKIVMSSCFHVR